MDFFFEGWPAGPGPMIVQVAMIVVGSALGIRVFDDIKKAREVLVRRRTQP